MTRYHYIKKLMYLLKNLGYDIFIGNDDRFGRDFCRISISWG